MDAHTSSAGLVQMHPTASRSHAAPSPVYAAPSAPSPPPPRPSPPAPVSRTASSASNAGASSPAAGLNLNPAQFPLYSTLPNVHPIRVITAQQYAQIQHEYTSLALPEKVLMPWSHLGADIAGTNAAAYFGFARGDAAAAPKSVPLLLVHFPALEFASDEVPEVCFVAATRLPFSYRTRSIVASQRRDPAAQK